MSGTSKRFYGTWPEGRRIVKDLTPKPARRVPRKPVTKALVRALPDVEIGPLRDSLEEGDQ